MNNIQFYFATGVPSILVILSWIQANNRSGDLKGNMNRQFDAVNRQFDAVNRRLDFIDGDLKHFHNVTGKLEGRVDELSNR